MPEYKYESYLDSLSCEYPPSDTFSPNNLHAYRWIQEDINAENNFLPVSIIKPSRLDGCDSCQEKCKYFGLSMFDNEKKAEERLKSFILRKPMLAEVFGNSIAEGVLNEEDGVVDYPDGFGHFNLYESANSDIKSKFSFLKKCSI